MHLSWRFFLSSIAAQLIWFADFSITRMSYVHSLDHLRITRMKLRMKFGRLLLLFTMQKHVMHSYMSLLQPVHNNCILCTKMVDGGWMDVCRFKYNETQWQKSNSCANFNGLLYFVPWRTRRNANFLFLPLQTVICDKVYNEHRA